MFNRVLLAGIVILFAFLSIRSFPSASATESDQPGFKKELYRVELDEGIIDKPALAAVWHQYGEMKVDWRTERFQSQFPNETKYRYTFEEEYECRMHLAEQWEKLKSENPRFSDEYLDNLVKVKNSRYFREYIYSYFKEGSWNYDKDRLCLDEFKRWRKLHMDGKKKATEVKLVEIELAEW